MNFIIGLGNPGSEYENTRHNLGFILVERLAQKLELKFENQTRLGGMIAKRGKLVLVKPTTYMNLSGGCVRKVLAFYAKELLETKNYKDVCIVHDDLDLKFGQTKFVFGSGPKAHNGVNSVREALGSDDFWYLRLGTDNRIPENKLPPHEYVLTRLVPEEKLQLDDMMSQVLPKIYAIATS